MYITTANLLNRKKTALDVEEELRFHIEMLEHKYSQHGMSTAEAKSAALRRFGKFERIRKQCVNIRSRNSLVRRVLKTSLLLLAFTGLSIHILSSDFKIARIGHVLITIAILGRLLLYLRGLNPAIFLHRTTEKSLSIATGSLENGSNLRGPA